jgi:hypothetical protein
MTKFCGIDARILDFFMKNYINKDNQIIIFNYTFTFQRFGMKYRSCGWKKKQYLMFSIWFWHQMKICRSGMYKSSYIPFWFIPKFVQLI